MTEEKLVQLYERIRKAHGSNFTADFGGYTMQRHVDGLVISIEPPQERLAQGENSYILLTAPLYSGTPEEFRDTLGAMILKRDALARKTYQGTLRDYDEGIEYAYEVPTADESKLVRIVTDFNDI